MRSETSARAKGTRPLAIEVDPGSHALTVVRSGHTPYAWEGSLANGQRLELTPTLRPIMGPSPETRSVSAEDGSNPLASPVFWLVAGTIVALSAVGFGRAFSDRARNPEPRTDRVYELDF